MGRAPRPPRHPPTTPHQMKYIVSGTSEQLGMRPRCDPTIRTFEIYHQGGGGGGVSAKCEVMGFWLKLATSKKGGGLPLLRATEIFQNAPRGVTSDVQKCVFVHFLGMQKEIWGCLASKVTDPCMLTGCCCFIYQVWQGRGGLRGWHTTTEAKSEVAHLWARWLHNPCRLGDPHRFRAGGKIRSGPLVGKVAT